MKTRKELGVGATCDEAKHAMGGLYFDESKHEIVWDTETNLFQVFNQRKLRDRTVKKSIRREGTEPYSYGKDKRPVVLILHPRELLEARLKGRRRGHVIPWRELYAYLVRRDALVAINFKRTQRKARKLATKVARKQNKRREQIRRLVN